MPAVHAVFLDVGWTLAYPRRSMWEIFAELSSAAAAPVTPAACEQFVRQLAEVGTAEAERRFHAGAAYADSDAEFSGQFAQLAGLIFARFGVEQGQEALSDRFLETFWNEENWAPFPEVEGVLAALRARGLKLGVLSNAPSNLPRFLERLGFAPYLDFQVVSAIEGVKKPDRRIFAAALARAGVAPEQAVHVGDMYLEDVVGGRAAGVRTLLMERGERALFPSYRESAGRALEPEAVVTSLTEVLERVTAGA